VPELPEVEVTRRSFVNEISGATITDVRVGKPLRWALGIDPSNLVGRQVLGLRRRGKYLLLTMSEGLLLLHLGMSGSIRFSGSITMHGLHDHFDLMTTHGILRLNDPRRFGAVVYAASESAAAAQKLLGHLGVEPFGHDFTPDQLYKGLQQKSCSIKAALLQGSVVVGVGNIYACESLFLAGIKPTLAANKLSRPRVTRLHGVIINVLQEALDKGGSSLKNFSSATGVNGHYQAEAYVYDRQAEPCKACSSPIKKIVQGQRSTYYCSVCQKR
jgi:formamidopyrimidine-DNA glycosylase